MSPSLFHFPLLLLLLLLSPSLPSSALPLSTSSRWIIDESGRRVKLACVNWPSHVDTMLAEGLSKQPLNTISTRISSMGFNCVRLTWALFMATNDSFSHLTVRQSFQSLNLLESLSAIQINNPTLIDLPLLQAFKAVVTNLGENKIMVILDNHISKPGWCCSNSDGNGFFGDKYFDPDVWVKGLTLMATMFSNSTNVVAMSLRNELRGPKQNVTDWYKYMQTGAEAVHSANPNVLVILSGLSFDNDLSFLSNKQINLTFTGKLVFELHWYGFSDGNAWASGNPNQVCRRVSANVMRKGGFLLNQGYPLFISEFGIDQRGTNVNDNRYIGCMLGLAAELDVDWALWTLQGSYYIREGVLGLDEVYGVLGWDWCKTRNVTFLERVGALQAPFQGPGLSEEKPYTVLFHPATGLCVMKGSTLFDGALKLGLCNVSEAWTYTSEKTFVPKGSVLCMKAGGEGEKVKVGFMCSEPRAKWEAISESKMHLSVSNGSLCLDVGGDGRSLVGRACRCLSSDSTCDPEGQWFRMVNSTRAIGSGTSTWIRGFAPVAKWWDIM